MRRPWRNDKLILYKDNFFIEEEKFKSSAIDSSVLYDLAKKMADTTEKKVHDKLEFVDTLDGKAVSEWFKAHAKNVDGTVRMAVAYPTKQTLAKFGFARTEGLSADRNILQFMYDDESGYILAFRIIEFKDINTSLQAQLEENGGLLAFKKE